MSQLKAYNTPNKQRKLKRVKKVFIAGTGAVGGTLINQIYEFNGQQPIELIGVCNSKNVKWIHSNGSKFSRESLLTADRIDWDTIIEKLSSFKKENTVFVDATGSNKVAKQYPDFLQNGVHVVTPSKLANSQSQEQFDHLKYLADENNVEFLYETNVGAGLPIIQTIKNLVHSGDEILEISGVLSGTMTYLFSELDKGKSFSKSVIQARTLGYAEPDPRDDLSGEDVARKFLILARVSGLKIERESIQVESLIPEDLKKVDSVTFLEKLPNYDEDWKTKLSEEHENGNTLRYTGSLHKGRITVGVESVEKTTPLGQLNGTNNLVKIKTRRYFDQPLIIQGPGAGKNVTAAGVLADILAIE